jgi:hypothetical protein
MVNGDDYTWYTGKARVKASTPDSRMSATVNLRILKDSVIWATIDKLGFEVARIFITPDSVFVVDRLNKEYTRTSLAAFLEEYGVRIGFRDLQNTLIGRMLSLVPKRIESKRESDLILLVVNDQSGITARHWVTTSFPQRLVRSDLVDGIGRKLEIENLDWIKAPDGMEIPYGRLLAFEDEDGVTNIEIAFSDIIRNVPANIPFSIPENYSRAR